MKNQIIIFSFVILCLFPNACNEKSTQPQSTQINNPMEPLYGAEVFEIEEELSIGAVQGPEEYMFGEVRDLAITPDGSIYVLDSKEDHIKVFNSQGEYIDTIGSPGQGPGELDRPTSICICQNDLYVTEGARKFSCFSLTGDFIKRIPSKEIWALRARINSLGNFIITSGVMDPEFFHYRLAIYDSDMNLIKEIATSPAPDARKEFNPFMAIAFWTLSKNDTIIYGYPQGYEIQIYDREGQIIKTITKDYKPIAITEKEKKEREGEFSAESKLVFPKYHSAFRRFFSDDEGRIFVQTWEKTEDEKNYYFDVFDQEGRYIIKSALPERPHSCLNNKLYTIEEDEDGYHYVKRYQVTWKIQ